MANPTNGTTKDSIVVRPCRPGELDELLLLWRQAGATVSLTDTVEDVRRAIVHPTACVLVADAGSRIVGSVFGGFDGWRGNIYRLAVHPEYRRQGVARRLVAEAGRHLARLGARRVTALAEKDHADATGFWTAAGYQLDTRIVRFVHNL
jgi:ribosomal protein S18 acetylase RimI-like enzyme